MPNRHNSHSSIVLFNILGLIVVAGLSLIPQFWVAEYTIWTIERKPFVYYDTDQNWWELTWFSIELMEEIAKRNDIEYTYQVEETFAEMIDNVSTATVDLAVANISITSAREKILDFSYPIYDSWLQVLIANPELAWSGKTIQKIVLVLFGLICVHLIVSRYKNVFGCIPASWLLMAVWICWCGYMVVNVSANRAGSGSPDSELSETTAVPYKLLQSNKLWVAVWTSMSEFLDKKKISYKAYDDFTDSLQALQDGKVSAVVGDAAVSKYFANHEWASQVLLAGSVFEVDKIWIAFPADSELREIMNRSLLQIQEDGTYERLVEKYFGDNQR